MCRAYCRRADGVFLKHGSWPMPPVFPWLQRLGDIEQAGDGPCLQPGHRLRDDRQPILCREHPRTGSWRIACPTLGSLGWSKRANRAWSGSDRALWRWDIAFFSGVSTLSRGGFLIPTPRPGCQTRAPTNTVAWRRGQPLKVLMAIVLRHLMTRAPFCAYNRGFGATLYRRPEFSRISSLSCS